MITVSHCFKHGNLTIDQVTKKGKENGVQRYRCKKCYREMRQKHYENNKGAILETCAKRRHDHPRLVAAIKKASRIKNAHKHVESERIRHQILNRVGRKELHDWYVRKLLVKRTALRTTDIPRGLVEIKKATIKIKRKTKEIIKEEIT